MSGAKISDDIGQEKTMTIIRLKWFMVFLRKVWIVNGDNSSYFHYLTTHVSNWCKMWWQTTKRIRKVNKSRFHYLPFINNLVFSSPSAKIFYRRSRNFILNVAYLLLLPAMMVAKYLMQSPVHDRQYQGQIKRHNRIILNCLNDNLQMNAPSSSSYH